MQLLETFDDFVHILHKSSHPSYAIKFEHKCYFGQVLFGDCFSIISISTDCLFFLFNSHRRSICEFFSSSGIFLVSVHQKYLKAQKNCSRIYLQYIFTYCKGKFVFKIKLQFSRYSAI